MVLGFIAIEKGANQVALFSISTNYRLRLHFMTVAKVLA